ncbi:MAG: UDP-N-acetylmuramoyl-L-alanine--D-glutamate ligase, partial [Rhizomicrobium sp.]
MPILDNVHRLAIWGFGREGRAVYDFVRAEKPDIAITILNDTALTDHPDVPVLTGADVDVALTGKAFDVIVKSPGISAYRDDIVAAKAAGQRFTTATNLWFEHNRAARIIAVTGTKGKSSTARLVQQMLDNAGLDAKLYGNVGIAMLGEPAGRDVTVLELSSYQVADLAGAPEIGVITSLYPEHAPWHHGTENYYRDKLRLLDVSPAIKGVCNFASERLRSRLEGREGLVWFNRHDGFDAEGETLLYAGVPVAIRNFPLKGAHNYANLAAACAAVDAFGIEDVRHTVDLSGFTQLAHRLEEFSVGDILCVNDSLCTVPEATMAALQTYRDKPKVLILGGTDRGQDFQALIDHLSIAGVKTVLLLPVTGERIFT